MKQSGIRCAVIGTGRIGSSLETDRLREKPASHAGAIARNRETTLVAGADPDAENLAAFGKLWKLPQSALFADAEAMLDAVHPDIAHIATDTDSHIPMLRLALAKRVPVIVLEKPVGSTIEEAREILPLVDEAERSRASRVVVNHERRFAADYRKARDIIRSGSLGRLLSVSGKLFMGKTKTPERVLWHDGTHLVDVIRFLVGQWRKVGTFGDASSSAGNFVIYGETEPAGDEKPIAIILETSPGRDHLTFELELSFSEGRIRIGNGVWEVWKSEPSRLYEQFRSLELQEGKPGRGFGRTGYFSGMMSHAVALYRDRELPGESTFRDGLAAIEILADILFCSILDE